MMDLCVEQTNIYSTHKSGTSISISKAELEQLLEMYLRMGVAQMSSVRSYWESNMACSMDSDVMTRNRFQKLVSLLHFENNLSLIEEAKPVDKQWRIPPWLQVFSQACLKKSVSAVRLQYPV